MATSTAQKLKDIFDAEAIDSFIVPPDETCPEERLCVEVYSPKHNLEWTIELHVSDSDAEYSGLIRDTSKAIETIHWFVEFFEPYSVEKVYDLARLAHMINKVERVPGFGVCEDFGKVYYRHTLFCTGNNIDKDIVLNTYAHIRRMLTHYYDTIHAVGKIGLERLLLK